MTVNPSGTIGATAGITLGLSSAHDIKGPTHVEERLLEDTFFGANASIVDEITALGHALLHPPKEPAASGRKRAGCLPDHWTGNPGDYNLTK